MFENLLLSISLPLMDDHSGWARGNRPQCVLLPLSGMHLLLRQKYALLTRTSHAISLLPTHNCIYPSLFNNQLCFYCARFFFHFHCSLFAQSEKKAKVRDDILVAGAQKSSAAYKMKRRKIEKNLPAAADHVVAVGSHYWSSICIAVDSRLIVTVTV